MKKTMRKAVMAVVAATLALSPVSVFAEEPKEVTIGIAWPSLGTQAWSAMAEFQEMVCGRLQCGKRSPGKIN